MNKLSFLFVLLVGFAVLSVASQPNSSPLGCFVSLHRLVGPRDYYVWGCVCPGPQGTSLRARGRVQVPAVSTSMASQAQSLATARCIRNARSLALRICLRSGPEFQLRAKAILQRCLSAPPNQAEQSQDGPFTYNESKCEAQSYLAEFPFIGVAWVCQCEQSPFYFVSPGRVDFRPAFRSNGKSLAEARVIDRCTIGKKDELSRVCSTVRSHFEVLALQILQTCCKRARVALPLLKSQCTAVVP